LVHIFLSEYATKDGLISNITGLVYVPYLGKLYVR